VAKDKGRQRIVARISRKKDQILDIITTQRSLKVEVDYIALSISGLMFIVNLFWLGHSFKHRVKSDLYMHIGLTVFFALLILEITLGNNDYWDRLNISWLRTVGWILYIPSAILVLDTIVEFHRGGQTLGEDRGDTERLVETGIFKYVRQPMTLGMAIWSIALLLLFQSVIALIMSIPAMILFWLSAKNEAEYNIKKFGKTYRDYMKRVPMWNIFKGVFLRNK
jgi:protein-S-isoprenylcysteine O-methyltransferase Ste14